jgi:hypothetical protein
MISSVQPLLSPIFGEAEEKKEAGKTEKCDGGEVDVMTG